MHEATIARHLVEAIARRIEDGGISGAVNRIHVRVGRLTAVVPDNLRHFFVLLAEGSAVEGAELEIEEVPVRARCRSCGTEFDIEGVRFDCLDCGSNETDVVGGRELKIVAVEVN
jgi:hydrogenase nickel incorporation protein HypA/HybF